METRQGSKEGDRGVNDRAERNVFTQLKSTYIVNLHVQSTEVSAVNMHTPITYTCTSSCIHGNTCA